MRLLIGISLITACASSPPEAGTSLRDRLAEPTSLVVFTTSTGAITAGHDTHDGWQAGTAALSIADGEAIVSAAGGLSLGSLWVDLAPIDLPQSVLDQPAQLRDVRLALATSPAVSATWTDDDNVIATATTQLDLSWSIFINNGSLPLGTQHLPPIAVELALSGDGDHITASFSVHATGQLWSWAGLFELTDLELSLEASA